MTARRPLTARRPWHGREPHFIMAGHEHRQWPAEGLPSTRAPGQPVPHRPLTRHGRRAAQPDPERLARASMPTLPTSGWLPSLASSGLVRVFIAAAAAISRAAGLNILIYLNPDPQLPMHSRGAKYARAYAREPHGPSSILGRAEADKLLSLPFDDSLPGIRCAALCTLLRCLAHARIACFHLIVLLCGRLWLWI